jgi:L-fuculose-phosphate aldolase
VSSGRRDEPALRRAIVATARRMNALGINRGSSGNVSARLGKGLLITPSSLPYEAMRPQDVVALAPDGSQRSTPRRRPRRPSTEWRLHLGVYAVRPDVHAIVHAHPTCATALACLRRGIPAFHYMVAVAGGDDIRCSRYATFGTQELAEAAVAALEERRACLLANHGIVACGSDLDDALALAVEVEGLAAQYWHALQIGEPVLLGPDEMRRVRRRFREYTADRGISRRRAHD